MTGIVFCDPPESRGAKGGSIAAELAPLRDRPGEWARVYGPVAKSWAYQRADHIKRGSFSGAQRGEFEATCRKLPDGHFVWVRYVGNGAGS